MLKKRYFPVSLKFWISHTFAFLWFLLSVFLSMPWINELSTIIGIIPAMLIIAAIAYLPGYLNAFMISSLLLDKQPKLKVQNPTDSLTILISCKNEE